MPPEADYLCLTVVSQPGEAQAAFSMRLSGLWTRMLRQRKEDFEKVYAETTEFEDFGGRWARQYLLKADVLEIVEAALQASGVEFEPVDRDEMFSKYEATPPEWMQIEH